MAGPGSGAPTMRQRMKDIPLVAGAHAFIWRHLPDAAYARWYYRKRLGKPLDLRHPRTFNEKLQWLKLHDRQPLHTRLADKYAVREYVRERVGERHLIPLLGVWDRPGEIPFASLPEAFVLKATHGCGWNILCPDRRALDVDLARRRLAGWLGRNYYEVGREWQYRDIPPRIVGEEFLVTPDGSDLMDYKFFCFHGEPYAVQVDVDRHTDHRRCFYDTAWQRLPFAVYKPIATRPIPRPGNLDEMVQVARALAQGLRFARVDLYSHGGRTLFGEITFYPGNGSEFFDPEEWDARLGERLRLDA